MKDTKQVIEELRQDIERNPPHPKDAQQRTWSGQPASTAKPMQH